MTLTVCTPNHKLRKWNKRRWSDFQTEYPKLAAIVNGYAKHGFRIVDIPKWGNSVEFEMERQTFQGEPGQPSCKTWIERKSLHFHYLTRKNPIFSYSNKKTLYWQGDEQMREIG